MFVECTTGVFLNKKKRLNILLKIASVGVLSVSATFGQVILTQNFDSQPNGYLTCSSGQEWSSPMFSITPLEYIKIQYISRCATNPGFIAGAGYNSATTYMQYASNAGWAPKSLVADDYSSVYASSGWTRGVHFTMARINATQEYVRFAGLTSTSGVGASSPSIDSLIISRATHAEVRAWVDSVFNAFNVPLNCVFAADRLDIIPRTMQKLVNGQRVRIVLLGDSVANDTGNSGFNVLLERLFPGSIVEVITAVGGGTGIDQWLSSTNKGSYTMDLQAACINQQPDLVIIAGISHPNNATTFNQMIDKLRNDINTQFGYTPDIMLMTKAYENAYPSTPKTDATWYRFVSSNNNNDYRHMLYRVSQTKQTAFFDMCGEWGQYTSKLIDAGFDFKLLWRDVPHANYLGKNIYAKIIEQYFSVPVSSVLRSRLNGSVQNGLSRYGKSVTIAGISSPAVATTTADQVYDCHGRIVSFAAQSNKSGMKNGIYILRPSVYR